LLEEKALREAAEHLGKDQTDAEVQELAKTTYQALSRQLPGQNNENYTSELMKSHRAAIQEGLGTATRNHLAALTAGNNGGTRALTARPAPVRSLSALNPLFSSLPPVLDVPLRGYPGLHTDRYVREFIELQVVGKGGYGTVYKVKHKLDNSFYAVKRIVVSAARLQKIHKNGPQEMENMLEEVRALARFDHGNIVRYHNCWLEFTMTPPAAPLPSTTLANDKLLEHVSGPLEQMENLQIAIENLSCGDPFDHNTDSGAGIVFEYSDADTGTAAEEPATNENNIRLTPRKRSGSQATIATHSSVRSRMSTIESFNGDEDDEIETIPRVHHPIPDPNTELSQSILSESDSPDLMMAGRIVGPVLTLNVQMSLYDTNLADFLASEPSPAPPNHSHHCFHTCISLELLASIISGVEYLHAQGVVHRDLKPANIFLALSTSKVPPSGSIDVSTCHTCLSRDSVHITPRIGDFGLVAALQEGYFTSSPPAKPVGTEFYRPEGRDSRVNEKLDVFALGVMAFEMLQPFSTRMERAGALTRLRRGEFPDGFTKTHGLEVHRLISGMIHPNEEERWSCEDVKRQLTKAIEHLRVQSNRGHRQDDHGGEENGWNTDEAEDSGGFLNAS
jgi:translation initiation factor 2-alpha kinase 3